MDTGNWVFWVAAIAAIGLIGFFHEFIGALLTGSGNALRKAVLEKDAEKLKELLDSGKDPNAYDSAGRTPLRNAFTHNDPQIIRILLSHGADPTVVCDDGDTSLPYCSREHLVAALGPDIDPNYRFGTGRTLLHVIAGVGLGADETLEELLDYCLSKGSVSDEKDEFGLTPLMVSVLAQSEITTCGPVTSKLIAAGADLDAQDDEGRTAVMYSVLKGDASAMNKLIDAGADLDLPNRRGDTPLHVAVDAGKYDFIKMLVEGGASRQIRNKGHATALDLAKFARWDAAVDIILNGRARTSRED